MIKSNTLPELPDIYEEKKKKKHKKKKDKYYIHIETTNPSFLKMYKILGMLGIEERDFFFNAEEWKGHINSQVQEDNTSYCMTIDFESLINPRDWRSIDICIDKTTMLITTVFGVNDWYQY